MRVSGNRNGSTDAAVNEFTARLEAAVARKERMLQRQDLINLIESGRHVLIGAKALAHHTQPQFTQESDYLVGGEVFVRIQKWMRNGKVEHEDLGTAIRCPSFGVDVLDARSNEVLSEILKRGKTPVSAEALAAAKYISFINPARGQRRLQDVADFAQLVTLPTFDSNELRTFFVGGYANQWPEIEKLIADIKAGRPITM
jgi:hypothetical protein